MISRGSEWRKWNLHMHSEYSRENRTKMKITEIFDSAVKNNISMISITDHSNLKYGISIKMVCVSKDIIVI